jgi:hypothetical protein
VHTCEGESNAARRVCRNRSSVKPSTGILQRRRPCSNVLTSKHGRASRLPPLLVCSCIYATRSINEKPRFLYAMLREIQQLHLTSLESDASMRRGKSRGPRGGPDWSCRVAYLATGRVVQPTRATSAICASMRASGAEAAVHAPPNPKCRLSRRLGLNRSGASKRFGSRLPGAGTTTIGAPLAILIPALRVTTARCSIRRASGRILWATGPIRRAPCGIRRARPVRVS